MAEKLTIQLGFDDADVRRGLQALKRKVPEDMKDMARKASVAIGSISLGLAVTTAKAAAEAETSFAKLATIAGKETGKLKAEILALDPALGSVQGAAEAAYQAISSGTKPQETIGLVKQAALAARGGFTDMRTAIDAVTTVLNSMGGESDKIFDQFLKTQNLGKTTFGEIAGSIGDVAANAKEFGQDLPTVLGQVATLTASGINTEKAITGIRQAVVNLTKPSKEAAEELARIGL
ncbi:MAG: phage tail tape measure protein, partial [Rhodospirillaceae bacterium]